jgi:hypothetical protein
MRLLIATITADAGHLQAAAVLHEAWLVAERVLPDAGHRRAIPPWNK